MATTRADTQAIGTAQLKPGSDGEPAMLLVNVGDGTPTSIPLSAEPTRRRHHGVVTHTWDVEQTRVPADAPQQLTLRQVVTLAGGRIPIGLDPRQNPGPYHASWSLHQATRIWRAHGILLDARHRSMVTVTLTSDSLSSPRTLRVADTSGLIDTVGSWHIASAYVNQATSQLEATAVARIQRQFWAVRLPIVLVIIALTLLLFAWRAFARRPMGDDSASHESHTPTGRQVDNTEAQGVTNAA